VLWYLDWVSHQSGGAFIDYEKAFDCVWRVIKFAYWNKILLIGNIDGKCFRIINNMHNEINAQIKFNGDLTSIGG
jgi:hypothetical protein